MKTSCGFSETKTETRDLGSGQILMPTKMIWDGLLQIGFGIVPPHFFQVMPLRVNKNEPARKTPTFAMSQDDIT